MVPTHGFWGFSDLYLDLCNIRSLPFDSLRARKVSKAVSRHPRSFMACGRIFGGGLRGSETQQPHKRTRGKREENYWRKRTNWR